MKIKVPHWAEDIDRQEYLVLFWFLRSLTQCYPPNLGHKKGQKKFKPVYDIYKKDIHVMLGTYVEIRKSLYQWPEVEANLEMGHLSNQRYRFILNQHRTYVEKEITDRRCEDMILYLSGCLNHNLVESKMGMKTEFGLNDALRDRFKVDDTNLNWYYETETE